MKQYLNLLQTILDNGRERTDRTGTGTIGIFGHQMKFDLAEGFPLVTTKTLHLRSIIYELLWMLSGSTNVNDLNKHGVTIWDEWADAQGELGPVYGKQWRSWQVSPHTDINNVDQIKTLVDNLKNDPFSRRHVISAWNVADLDKMALAPCHCLFQFHVEELTLRERWNAVAHPNDQRRFDTLSEAQAAKLLDQVPKAPRYRLNCQLYQRSADVFLGVPFNIASYALLTHMLAQVNGFAPGVFTHTFGDVHIYKNHVDQVKLQLSREPRPLPRLLLNPEVRDLFAFKYEDVVISDYNPHPTIKAPVAV